MKITFNLKSDIESLSMSTNRLPEDVVVALCKDRKFWKDLPYRLSVLPVVHKGRYIGLMPENTPHENAVKFAQQHKLDLCVGYIVTKEPREDWKIDVYSFCVRPEDERVVDPTKGHDWAKKRVFYLGFRVPKKDIQNMKYLHMFERLNYVQQHMME